VHPPSTRRNIMKITLRQFALTAAAFAVTASCSLPSFAQDVRREDMVLFFKMDKVDANKDKMVSKKEFLDAMSKSWDMHMADVKKMEGDKMGADKAADPKMKDKMTLDQYIEFSKMFGLNIGG
jgi:hypothetical protein